MSDDRVRHGEGPAEPTQVLVVVERIAARPVDQADPGVGLPPAVIVIPGARLQQHVRDPGHRDERLDRVAELRQGRQPQGRAVVADIAHRAVAVPEPAARHPDLAEHRGQRDGCPHRLLAVLDSLQRPGDRDQGPARRHLACQMAYLAGLDAADRRGPGCVLDDAVCRSRQVALEGVVSGGAAVQELAVVQSLRCQGVREAEHQGGIGRGDQRIPPGVQLSGQVRADGADQRDPDPAGCEGGEMTRGGVPGHPAGRDEDVLLRDAAEGHDQLGARHDRGPG